MVRPLLGGRAHPIDNAEGFLPRELDWLLSLYTSVGNLDTMRPFAKWAWRRDKSHEMVHCGAMVCRSQSTQQICIVQYILLVSQDVRCSNTGDLVRILLFLSSSDLYSSFKILVFALFLLRHHTISPQISYSLDRSPYLTLYQWHIVIPYLLLCTYDMSSLL